MSVPGAAKASLQKARRRLRAHITAHRPDLIPVSWAGAPAARSAAISPGTTQESSGFTCASPYPVRVSDGRAGALVTVSLVPSGKRISVLVARESSPGLAGQRQTGFPQTGWWRRRLHLR